MVDWIALIVPFAYLSILVGSLATFSSLYRRRKTVKATSLAPWFPPHRQRDVYLSLMHLESESSDEKSPKIPDSVLKAALLRRATEDIHRIMQIRNAKQALGTLLQRGSVGDDLWQRFLRAESEMEDELREVVMEANAFAPNWGQTIFQSANEMAGNAMLRKRIDDLQSQTKSEKEWWEQRRATIQSDFMKELDQKPQQQASSDASSMNHANHLNAANSVNRSRATTPVGGASASAAAGEKEKERERERERGTSDEDTVLVEGGGPTTLGGGGKGSVKKKKGKK